ncbi:unnamed protein product [Trichobilharzia regenti]|nr:unnamed protein product [Trichobilharzia regenti]
MTMNSKKVILITYLQVNKLFQSLNVYSNLTVMTQ